MPIGPTMGGVGPAGQPNKLAGLAGRLNARPRFKPQFGNRPSAQSAMMQATMRPPAPGVGAGTGSAIGVNKGGMPARPPVGGGIGPSQLPVFGGGVKLPMPVRPPANFTRGDEPMMAQDQMYRPNPAPVENWQDKVRLQQEDMQRQIATNPRLQEMIAKRPGNVNMPSKGNPFEGRAPAPPPEQWAQQPMIDYGQPGGVAAPQQPIAPTQMPLRGMDFGGGQGGALAMKKYPGARF